MHALAIVRWQEYLLLAFFTYLIRLTLNIYKLQNTVETTTYGLEFVATKQCAEQVRELQETLKFIGILIEETAWKFSPNKVVKKFSK